MAPPIHQINLVLDGKAEYIKDGDTVLVAVFLVDPELELGFPGHVITGTCSLLYRGTEIRTITFDKRFGNGKEGEGDFVFQFLHPSVTKDLQVKLLVHIPPPPSQGGGQGGGGQGGGQGGGGPIGGPVFTGILTKTIPVIQSETPYIPLQPQPDTGEDVNDELRSKKRLEEEL